MKRIKGAILFLTAITLVIGACVSDPSTVNEGIVTQLPDTGGPVIDTINPQQVVDEYLNGGARFGKQDFRAEITKAEFDALDGAELERVMIRPIYSAIFDRDDQDDQFILPHLTEGQKALYYFRKFDDVITQDGIVATFDSPLGGKMQEAITTFESMGLDDFGKLLRMASIEKAKREKASVDSERIEKISGYNSQFGEEYIGNQDEFYDIMNRYIKNHATEFVKFKE